ncbi:hypothetical protein S40288_11779, partial [Stachybotrys chartarum IBT 40288]
MLRYIIFLLLSQVLADDCPDDIENGVWRPRPGETFTRTRQILGLEDFHRIQELNEGLDPDIIISGRPYVI